MCVLSPLGARSHSHRKDGILVREVALYMSGQQEYADLVREQLDAIGYDSRAIPDNVLREFLADFEEQMDIASEDAPAVPLSYPTALSSAEAQGVPRKPVVAPRPAASSSAGQPPRTAPSRRRKPEPEPRPSAGMTHDDGVISSPPLGKAEYATALEENDPPKQAPSFSSTQWERTRPKASSPAAHSAFRSASEVVAPRPQSARRPSLGSHSFTGAPLNQGFATTSQMGGAFSGGGVIISASTLGAPYGGTPRSRKSDPVLMHSLRQQQWRSDSFLAASTAKPRHVPVASPAPAAVSTVAASRRRLNTYVVPTSKRRDEVSRLGA